MSQPEAPPAASLEWYEQYGPKFGGSITHTGNASYVVLCPDGERRIESSWRYRADAEKRIMNLSLTSGKCRRMCPGEGLHVLCETWQLKELQPKIRERFRGNGKLADEIKQLQAQLELKAKHSQELSALMALATNGVPMDPEIAKPLGHLPDVIAALHRDRRALADKNAHSSASLASLRIEQRREVRVLREALSAIVAAAAKASPAVRDAAGSGEIQNIAKKAMLTTELSPPQAFTADHVFELHVLLAAAHSSEAVRKEMGAWWCNQVAKAATVNVANAPAESASIVEAPRGTIYLHIDSDPHHVVSPGHESLRGLEEWLDIGSIRMRLGIAVAAMGGFAKLRRPASVDVSAVRAMRQGKPNFFLRLPDGYTSPTLTRGELGVWLRDGGGDGSRRVGVAVGKAGGLDYVLEGAIDEDPVSPSFTAEIVQHPDTAPIFSIRVQDGGQPLESMPFSTFSAMRSWYDQCLASSKVDDLAARQNIGGLPFVLACEKAGGFDALVRAFTKIESVEIVRARASGSFFLRWRRTDGRVVDHGAYETLDALEGGLPYRTQPELTRAIEGFGGFEKLRVVEESETC